MMGGEMYCDGGIVASNPAAVAVHEARCIFPDIPIELVVSIGTGGKQLVRSCRSWYSCNYVLECSIPFHNSDTGFLEQKNAPRIGWDGIIGQIVNSATDAEQIHHVLEDILGEGSENNIRRGGSHVSRTRYFRLNPTLGMADEFPIDVTEPAKLNRLKEIAAEYLAEPAQQRKLEEIGRLRF
jgi:calcium-independent phospholipase A2-gamma